MKTKFLPTLLLIIGMTMSFTGFGQVTITVNVNLSGYAIGSGGVHLAGTFASTGCQTITNDWDPAAPGSELQWISGSLYRIQLSFPSTSAGQQLVFLVVRNNIWYDGYEDFSEGNPGMTYLNSSCGVDDNYGGYNRAFIIPSSNAIFYAHFDFCGTLSTCDVPLNTQTTAITATSAQLNWTPASVGIKYQVRYRAEGGNWIYQAVNDLTSYQFLLTGLTPSTKYQWEIRTVCVFGYSEWTNKMPFKTAALKIDGENESGEFNIYPNPATSSFTVQLSNSSDEISYLKLYDITGRMVKQVNPIENSEIKIQRDDLPSGIYLLKIKSGEQEQLAKVIFE